MKFRSQTWRRRSTYSSIEAKLTPMVGGVEASRFTNGGSSVPVLVETPTSGNPSRVAVLIQLVRIFATQLLPDEPMYCFDVDNSTILITSNFCPAIKSRNQVALLYLRAECHAI